MGQFPGPTPPNALRVGFDELRSFYGRASWAHHLIRGESMHATIICQDAGPKPRGHWHPTSNEWWIVLEGETERAVEWVGAITARKNTVASSQRTHQPMKRNTNAMLFRIPSEIASRRIRPSPRRWGASDIVPVPFSTA